MVSNIWVAAADDDIKQVQQYISSGAFTANSKDPNGYTPVHAAASYGNIALLRYLIAEQHGDVNVQDNDGDTPLHHCEELRAARALVEEFHADWRIKNHDNQTAADAIEEEGEDGAIVEYLRSLEHDPTGASYVAGKLSAEVQNAQPVEQSQSEQDQAQQRNDGIEALVGGLSDTEKQKVRLTLEDASRLDSSAELDEEQKKRLEEIVNSEDPETQLRQFVQQTVHENFQKIRNGDGESVTVESKKRKN